MTPRALVERAIDARQNAYAPYSGFRVGAALLGSTGQVFYGCNIENSAFSPTLCAERVAFGSAIAAGCRDFSAIAVVGGAQDNTGRSCFPCGVCRQIMREFCRDDFLIYLLDGEQIVHYRLDELLPHSFALEGEHGHAHD